MGVDVETAALGVVRVANSAMVRALRRVTVERGVDGRRCTLLAFGGAGPMHAVEVARAFAIDEVVVPAHSGVFSALGCAAAQMSYSRQRTLRMAVADWDRERLERARRDLEARLVAPLAAAGHDASEITVEEVAAVRYRGQSYAVEIPDPPFDDAARMGERFFDRHRHLYGFATEEPWELVSIRTRAFVPRSRDRGAPIRARRGAGTAPVRSLPCTFVAGEKRMTPRHDRAALVAERPLAGPLVVEDAWSTTVVPPGATLVPDRDGHLRIDTGCAA